MTDTFVICRITEVHHQAFRRMNNRWTVTLTLTFSTLSHNTGNTSTMMSVPSHSFYSLLLFCFLTLHLAVYTNFFKFETYLIHKIYYGMFTKLHCIKYLLNILNIHCTITTKYQSNSDSYIKCKLKLNDSCICFCFGTWQGVGFGTPLQRQKQYAQHRVRKASEDMFELKKAKWTKPSESALMNKTKAKARRNKIR